MGRKRGHFNDPSLFATHPPPLVAVDKSDVHSRCSLLLSAVADASHNLTLCDQVMSMQGGYNTSFPFCIYYDLQWLRGGDGGGGGGGGVKYVANNRKA